MILSKIDSEFLRYLLADGHKAGERLPSLQDISAETGLSVGKLREQFEVARTLGLVEGLANHGSTSRRAARPRHVGMFVVLAIDRTIAGLRAASSTADMR